MTMPFRQSGDFHMSPTIPIDQIILPPSDIRTSPNLYLVPPTCPTGPFHNSRPYTQTNTQRPSYDANKTPIQSLPAAPNLQPPPPPEPQMANGAHCVLHNCTVSLPLHPNPPTSYQCQKNATPHKYSRPSTYPIPYKGIVPLHKNHPYPIYPSHSPMSPLYYHFPKTITPAYVRTHVRTHVRTYVRTYAHTYVR